MIRACAFSLVLFALPALAVEVGGVNLGTSEVVAGKPLALNGAGVRSMFFVKVYVASLWLPQKAGTVDAVLAETPRRVQLDVLRNLSANTLLDALDKGLEANNSASELQAIADQRAQLAQIMKRLGEAKKGDVIALDFDGNGTTVLLNDKPQGTIASEAFNRALMKVWLGPNPVQADLKRELLGS